MDKVTERVDSRRRQTMVVAAVCALAPVGLSGCMALAVAAPFIPLAGGVVPGGNVVSIDESTVSGDVKRALAGARVISVISAEPTTIYMAEYLDEKRAFEVRMVDPPTGATPSQRRELMRKTCADKVSRTDMVLSASAGTSDAGSGMSNVGAFLLGRVMINLSSNVETLRCQDGAQGRFAIKIEMNQGLVNMDQNNINQVLGHEAAKALMKLAGKT